MGVAYPESVQSGEWLKAYGCSSQELRKADIVICCMSRMPILVFDKTGEKIAGLRSDHALCCADINLDAEENLWYHLFPSSTIEVLGKDESH